MGALQEFIKGSITAEALTVGGSLKPQAANKFIDMVIDQSGFLKQVTIERMSKLKKDISVLDIANRILVRVAEGTEPADNQKAGLTQKGKTLSALYCQLFDTVLFSALEDNKDNPGYEDQLAAMFSRKFANEVTDLALNGTDETGAGFLTLNKGYVQLAKDSATSVKVDVGTMSTNYVNSLKAIISAQQDRFKPGSALVLAPSDYEGLLMELGAKPSGIVYLIQGGVPAFMGYPITTNPYMPANHCLFTPLTNYVYGICTDIQRYREVRGTKRCIDYTFNIAMDYAFGIDEAVVIGYDVP